MNKNHLKVCILVLAASNPITWVVALAAAFAVGTALLALFTFLLVMAVKDALAGTKVRRTRQGPVYIPQELKPETPVIVVPPTLEQERAGCIAQVLEAPAFPRLADQGEVAAAAHEPQAVVAPKRPRQKKGSLNGMTVKQLRKLAKERVPEYRVRWTRQQMVDALRKLGLKP